MSTIRSRSREKLGVRVSTTIRGINDVALLASNVRSSSVQTESMIDAVTKDWARLNREGFYPPQVDYAKTSHLRDAAKHGYDDRYYNLRRFVPPVNPLTYSSTRDEEPQDTIVFTVDPQKTWATVRGCCLQGLHGSWGNAFPAHNPPTPVSTALLTAVLKSRVLKRCASTDYAFGEDMLEVRQTLQFIRSPFRSLTRLLTSMENSIGRRRLVGSTTYARESAAAWAEYRFAAAPLARAADDAISASADYFHKKYASGYIRFAESDESVARSTADGTTQKNLPYAGGYSGVSWTLDVQSLRTVTNHVTVGLKALHTDTGSLSSLIGLRGRDIPLTLWQVFPLSFMIDRVYDVSGWLQASSNFLSSKVQFAGGWVSTRTTSSWTRRYSGIRSPFPTFNYATPPCSKPWFHEEFSYSREAWTPLVADARPPALAGRLVSSLTHTADLAAIIVSQASRLARKR
jgi:hypothetical protein